MVHGMYWSGSRDLLSGVKKYHEKNPSSPGMSREHLRSSVQGGVDPKLFHRVLQDLIRKGDLSESGPTIAANGFSASMASDHTDALEAIAKAVEAAAIAPPPVAELAAQLRLPQRKVVEYSPSSAGRDAWSDQRRALFVRRTRAVPSGSV
jgi:hypothetical protein